eukprot:7330015-Prymnesium_polylepis.1
MKLIRRQSRVLRRMLRAPCRCAPRAERAMERARSTPDRICMCILVRAYKRKRTPKAVEMLSASRGLKKQLFNLGRWPPSTLARRPRAPASRSSLFRPPGGVRRIRNNSCAAPRTDQG